VITHYFLADGQSNPHAIKLALPVQSLKQLKDAVYVFFIKTNSVIRYINPVIDGERAGLKPSR
jgi:hypothetical protein